MLLDIALLLTPVVAVTCSLVMTLCLSGKWHGSLCFRVLIRKYKFRKIFLDVTMFTLQLSKNAKLVSSIFNDADNLVNFELSFLICFLVMHPHGFGCKFFSSFFF